jgi:hypothetical protein
MKNFNTLIIIVFSWWMMSATQAFGATPTISPSPVASPTAMPDAEALQNLKDRIASRVAQLKLVEKRGFVGTVTDVDEIQLTLRDLTGATRFVDVDELTRFSSPSARGNFGISDIKPGTTVGVLGLYNKQSKRLLARFVNVTTNQTVINGVVSGIDPKNFTISLTTYDNTSYTIDVQSTTRTLVSEKAGSPLTRSGFSRITKGERIVVVGIATEASNTLTALRIIRLPSVAIPQSVVLFSDDQLTPTPAPTRTATKSAVTD